MASMKDMVDKHENSLYGEGGHQERLVKLEGRCDASDEHYKDMKGYVRAGMMAVICQAAVFIVRMLMNFNS